MSTVETLQGLLRRFAPFAQLNDDQLNVLAEQARPFSCPTGQELLRLVRRAGEPRFVALSIADAAAAEEPAEEPAEQ